MTLPTTFAEMLTLDRDNVALNVAECGVAVTQYPLGVVANAVPVTAILGKGFGQKVTTRGVENTQATDIWCSSAVSTSAQDQWLIQGQLWQTLALNGDVGGLTHITLKETTLEKVQGPGHIIGGPR